MSDKPEFTVKIEDLGEEVEKVIHASKSYVGTAFLTLLLYYVGFFFIGLVCNLVFLSQSNNSRRIAGVAPSGRGCLVFLLWVHLVIPLIIIVILIASGVFASSSCY